jgi:hypothetical protein
MLEGKSERSSADCEQGERNCKEPAVVGDVVDAPRPAGQSVELRG